MSSYSTTRASCARDSTRANPRRTAEGSSCFSSASSHRTKRGCSCRASHPPKARRVDRPARRRERDRAGARRTIRAFALCDRHGARSLSRIATRKCRCRRTSRARPTHPTTNAIRPCMRGTRARSRRRPPGCISTRRCSRACRRRVSSCAYVTLARRRRHFPAGRDRGSVATPHAQRALQHPGGDRRGDRRRHALSAAPSIAVGTTSLRALEAVGRRRRARR